MKLELLNGEFAIARLNATDGMPSWVNAQVRSADFLSITKTADELSIVCESSLVPEGIRAQRGWRALKIEGPLDFALVGVLVSIVQPLVSAGISIFAISTFDTDYVLVGGAQLGAAIAALQSAGHDVRMAE